MGCATESCSTTALSGSPPLNALRVMTCAAPNRAFALIYVAALLALFYRHLTALVFHSTPFPIALFRLCLLLSDAVLAFAWATKQSCRLRPVSRREFPENLATAFKESRFPPVDVFICTADPRREPPAATADTALSVMAYDYPPGTVSVYVSDDGGSEVTLFALMEAAEFGRHWLPFCRERKTLKRNPESYFTSHPTGDSQAVKLKVMYESMKCKIENAVERGRPDAVSESERKAFSAWRDGFTCDDHPTVIQVLLEGRRDADMSGREMPNLVYISRQKSSLSPHRFKAGAQNVLLRVSATMTNAPIILTLDCDTRSNDPGTLLRALCYFYDPALRPLLGYVQFPQRFTGVNKHDIYGSEYKRLFQINPMGMDGFRGPNNVGTGVFFSRRAFFGGPHPSAFVSPETPDLRPGHLVDRPITSPGVLKSAHEVARCDYENGTVWGLKMGFRYGSLVEDYFTGYLLQCEGWRSVFCNPHRAAFLGGVPTCLNAALMQCRRWCLGVMQVAFSHYSPFTFGVRALGPLTALSYAHCCCWPLWPLPVLTYAFLPQLALLNGIPLFPKASDPWFLLYMFLFFGSYGQDLLDFMMFGGTVQRWWSDQRVWMMKGLSCYLFGSLDFLFNILGVSAPGFSLTSKVVDGEEGKRYEQGVFQFRVASPMFIPFTTAAIVNLSAFLGALFKAFRSDHFEAELLAGQMFLTGYIVVNAWPVYEGVVRSDKGKIPIKITLVSAFLAGGALCIAFTSSIP